MFRNGQNRDFGFWIFDDTEARLIYRVRSGSLVGNRSPIETRKSRIENSKLGLPRFGGIENRLNERYDFVVRG
jgi:hypothetical protein